MKPFLTRRKNGIWYIVETDSSGKRRWLSTNQKNRRGAERLLERLNPTDQIPMGGMPISQFLSDLLSHLQPSYAPATIVIYESAIRNLIANVGDISITTVTARDIDQFKTARLAQVSPVSVNIELRTIKAAFNIALRWELITSNPFKGVKQVRIPDRLPTYLSRSQWIALDARLNGVWIHPIIIFAVNTGMRQGEILNLEWSQVDLARRVVHVCSTSTFKTKTGKSRIVPLNETAHAVLLNLPTKGELVFTRDGRPILPNSLLKYSLGSDSGISYLKW